MAVPAAAEMNGDLVISAFNERGYIKGRNVYSVCGKHLAGRIAARLVIGGKRQKRIGVYASSVYITLKKAQTKYPKRNGLRALK